MDPGPCSWTFSIQEARETTGKFNQGGKRGRKLGFLWSSSSLSTPLPGTSFSRLRRELEQCKQDIQNLPFPPSENQSQTLYPLWEFPLGGRGIGFVNALLTSSEVRNLKRELRSLIEDPQGLADQPDQFLLPQVYTWAELMSILRKEEGSHDGLGDASILRVLMSSLQM
jgi:hypothetical protein